MAWTCLGWHGLPLHPCEALLFHKGTWLYMHCAVGACDCCPAFTPLSPFTPSFSSIPLHPMFSLHFSLSSHQFSPSTPVKHCCERTAQWEPVTAALLSPANSFLEWCARLWAVAFIVPNTPTGILWRLVRVSCIGCKGCMCSCGTPLWMPNLQQLSPNATPNYHKA